MTQPTPYTRQYSFTNAFAASPTMTFPGASLDLEFNSVKVTADQVLQNLKLLQNDDGTIKNGSIGSAQLAVSLQTGFTPPAVWAPNVAYLASPASTVFTSNKFYSCLVSHTSGVFATDLVAGKWVLIADLTSIPLQTAVNIAITPAGGIVATDVQTAAYGLDTRITSNTNSITGFVAANVTDSTTSGRAVLTGTADAGLSALNAWSTGDAKITIKTVADPGWLMMADQTIGSATSGATYANALAQNLYLLLWTSVSDALAPVTGGRGVSNAADWAANKKMALLKVLGRAISISGTGFGLTSHLLGGAGGAETVQLVPANLPAYTPTGSITTNVSAISGTVPFAISAAGAAGASNQLMVAGSTAIAIAAQPTASSAFTGDAQGGVAQVFSILPPSSYWNVMIKL